MTREASAAEWRVLAGERRQWITWRSVPALTVAALAFMYLAFPAFTGVLKLRPGYGYDGTEYLRLVSAFRSGIENLPAAPYAYRILPSALVAASQLDPWIGFAALDLAALLATALVLLALLRPHVSPAGALALTISWGLLPLGLRFAVNYPILTDPLATFLFAATLLAAQRSAAFWFSALLVGAVLTRENLIVLAPLLFLRELRHGGRAAATALAAVAPGAVALLIVRLFPPITPGVTETAFEHVGYHGWELLTNHDGRVWRVLAAPLFAFGAAVGPLATRRTLAVFRAEPGWSYLCVAVAVTSALGGGDVDRYLFVLAPLVLTLAARATLAAMRLQMAVALVLAQLAAGRLAMPLGADRGSYLGFGVGTATLDTVAFWSAVVLVSAFCVWIAATRPLPRWRIVTGQALRARPRR